MKKVLTAVVIMALLCLCACGEHEHKFKEWEVTLEPTCAAEGERTHICKWCKFAETEAIQALPHTEVIDNTVAATCTTDGKTEGSHCSVCNAIIVAQETVAATGHNEGEPEITLEATCRKDGTKKYTCSVCNESRTESYKLPVFTAEELYDQALKYVGEIKTYNIAGDECALGTGFVIASDGKILTNYHVLEGAYSAEVTIDSKTYDITSVLAYDKELDLAVIKINAHNLSVASICKEELKVGQKVFAHGSSQGMTDTFSQGTVTHASREMDGVKYIQHGVPVSTGNSGGPLLNEFGEVVGINTWYLEEAQNLNFAISTSEIDRLTYGKALTMDEFYENTADAFEEFSNIIMETGELIESDGESAYYAQGIGTVSGITVVVQYIYTPESDMIMVATTYIYDNGIYVTMVLCLGRTENGSIETYFAGSYDYNDEELNRAEGHIDAAKYTVETMLDCDEYVGMEEQKTMIMNSYSACMVSILEMINAAFAEMGMNYSVADFGFIAF